MKTPRDVSGKILVRALRVLEYRLVRQDGSHMRLTTERGGVHHITVPNHSPMRVGTPQGILKAVATHHRVGVEELCRMLAL